MSLDIPTIEEMLTTALTRINTRTNARWSSSPQKEFDPQCYLYDIDQRFEHVIRYTKEQLHDNVRPTTWTHEPSVVEFTDPSCMDLFTFGLVFIRDTNPVTARQKTVRQTGWFNSGADAENTFISFFKNNHQGYLFQHPGFIRTIPLGGTCSLKSNAQERHPDLVFTDHPGISTARNSIQEASGSHTVIFITEASA